MRRSVFFLLLGALACGEASPETAPDAGTAAEPVVAEPEAPIRPSPVVEEVPEVAPIDDGSPIASIPAGEVLVGSRPGSLGRNATAEADLIPISLPAFEIDRRPYPNDPNRPAMVNVDRRQAAELCERDGKRLCTELEWERACKGDTDRLFPVGDTFATEGMSPFGVYAMGTAHGEWTASPDVRDLAPGTANAAVFRGAAPDQEAPFHRCAARRATAPSTQSRHLTFRCCRGAEPEATYPTERTTPRVQRLEQSLDEMKAHLASVPEVADFADRFVPATDESMTRAVGDLELLHGWELAGPVLRWTPVDGEEVWVYSGKVDDRAAVIALFRTADERLLHGASMLFDPEEGPVAVAFTPPERRFLKLSVDWALTAADAVLVYGEDATLSFEPR
ncbi:MAG: hypothetical protein JJ863_24430 [Deltaproteobacteria bacterium]|nr:hypothetical protein [Deltaproteobacteria bacterium]